MFDPRDDARDRDGREAFVRQLADVIFNAGQPLLQMEGEKARLLPCQPPFLTRLDRAAGVITLDLPAGFDEF